MINPDWVSTVKSIAESSDGKADYRTVMSDLCLWWINKTIGHTGAIPELDWDRYLPVGVIEVDGAWDSSEEADAVQRFGVWSFAEFWEAYDYTAGSKAKTRSAFRNLTKKELSAIKQVLHIYKAETYTKVEVKGKVQRKYAQFFLSKKERRWETIMDRYDQYQNGGEQRNLDGIFAKLNVNVGYMIAPSIEDLLHSLGNFKTSVDKYDERLLINALQEFYDEKGQYAGKIANILRSQDFRPYYQSWFKK